MTVRLSGNPMPPMSDADVWFSDDDYLRDGQDVPMPDTGELGSAMAEAYVSVLYDVGDNDTNVPFILNVPFTNADVVAAQRWNSVADNSSTFWVAYVLGAFQGRTTADNDPDSEAVSYGNTPSNDTGGSLVFIEVNKDAAREDGHDPIVEERDTVVHEVGHAFRGHTEPVTLYQSGGPVRYLEVYLRQIRSVEKPASR